MRGKLPGRERAVDLKEVEAFQIDRIDPDARRDQRAQQDRLRALEPLRPLQPGEDLRALPILGRQVVS